ncbi:MAG: cytochrome c, partial [Lentisphaerae bacterium]|nr:cytochrome c [Lentisphaerota bacterium]
MKNIIRIIMICCALTSHFALSGCGSGGSGGAQNSGVAFTSGSPSNSTALQTENAVNSYSLTEDTYGLQNATFMSATASNGSFVLRAAIAGSMTDPNFTTVFRIDILQPSSINGNSTYSIGGKNVSGPQFPGEILFFNGHKSSLLNTISGSITFTSYGTNYGDAVAGSFAVLVEDQNSATRPGYSVKGNFNFVLNTYGVLVPTPSPVPAAARGEYNAKCASCHALGSFDPSSAGGAHDL